jgi:glucose-6-phosphate 1-dehydrogenase
VSTSTPELENPLREGLERRRLPEPCTIVLFGASGDLTRRKLLPALYHLASDGLLPAKAAVVGFARRAKSDADFRAEMLEAVEKRARSFAGADELWRSFSESLFYHQGSFTEAADYQSLREHLRRLERDLGLPGNRLHYLAAAPEQFVTIVEHLGRAGLAPADTETEGRWVRIVVEKPFGRDLSSSRELNRALLSVVDESQLFRIDHYLGKETVQNILALRFANCIFEPLWNHKYIDHVQITVAEDLGLEGRGGYYDRAGALRDMAQNHLLQLLCLVAMEPPVALEADSIRDEKVKVLRAVKRIPPGEVERRVVRGQYVAGAVGGREVKGYRQEEGVDPESRTESYVALRLEIDNWRWAGVPFLLRSGKRLPKRATEISIQFQRPPMRLFGEEVAATAAPNALIINVQPDEGISLRFGSKVPGPDVRVRQVKMDFRYGSAFGMPSPEAYERLLLDALLGDSTLFTRRDEVEAAWLLMTDILEGWSRLEEPPHPYPAGSWGPAAADRLAAGVEGGWRRL